ncbi:hypothetical protein FHL15_006782 [Xylaria flabelliformis]|uniref:mRNA N(6)-methyladenine demethylase n=1 Tax=Xylaria flabelliformis TaxID=2512241 RepID=A0A553HWR8_9PEZI|nr:hypothetical protein FHL15_006782 [Xylaria flabelliformis]
MAIDLTTLDAHEQPSDELRAHWKTYSRTDHAEFVKHPDIDELDISNPGDFRLVDHIPGERLKESFRLLQGHVKTTPDLMHDSPKQDNRDGDDTAANSFFSYTPESPARFTPKDPQVHKPLTIKQVLERRLSWVTLGGQYNWSDREYPNQLPPEFPEDIAGFLQTLFPETIAQAAIVNFYTPGDTMMMHRDVSEQTDKGLVSLSIGCDALFMIAPNEYGKPTEDENATSPKKQYLLLRLRSGDAIYMSQESRYAWHGVPKVLKGTCPEFLQDWPAEDGNFEEWRGWMRNKRINLNVRQIK